VENKVRILIVDDETGLCDFIRHYLTGRGFEVVVAFSSQEALEVLNERAINIVLSDIMMPSMDGLELLRQIKESNPQVVVIMMTAYASLDKAVKAIAYGAADLLIKPFEVGRLLQVINDSLQDIELSSAHDQPPSQPSPKE
jgi:DNA-binding NtrC family response regulator